MGERDVRNVEASGSIPLTSTNFQGRSMTGPFHCAARIEVRATPEVSLRRQGPSEPGPSRAPETKKAAAGVAFSMIRMARPERFELPTPWFVAKYSIQMSYGRLRGPNYTQESVENKVETACRRGVSSGCRRCLDHFFCDSPIRRAKTRICSADAASCFLSLTAARATRR